MLLRFRQVSRPTSTDRVRTLAGVITPIATLALTLGSLFELVDTSLDFADEFDCGMAELAD